MMLCQLLFFVIAVINCLVSAQQQHDEVVFKKLGTYITPNAQYVKTYWVPRHFKTHWMHARSICKAYGFDILTLDTLDEMNTVSSLCEQNRDMFGAYTHIGGMASVGKSNTDWYWVTTNQKVSYNMPWHNGQPDHYGNNEWCLTLAKDSRFKFNDINCFGSWEEKFICQSQECAMGAMCIG